MHHKECQKITNLAQEEIGTPHVFPGDPAQQLHMHTPQMCHEISVLVHGKEHIAIPGPHVVSTHLIDLVTEILNPHP
jgi:hypothetical protein